MTEQRVPAPRVGRGELISSGSALALLVLLFAVKWFGVNQLPSKLLAGAGRATSLNGWQGLAIVRWLVLLAIMVAIGSLVLHINQSQHGRQTDTGAAVMVLGLVAAGLLIYRVLIALPASYQVVDQKLGAMLGLLSALGIALGGYESMREERERAGLVSKRSRDRLASRRATR